MNADSTQPCGCDPAANYKSLECKKHCMLNGRLFPIAQLPVIDRPENPAKPAVIDEKTFRKQRPVYSGFLCYFPDVPAEVAHISFAATQQHHPDKPMHWDRSKSTDHMDAALRHQADHAKGLKLDTDGKRHLAKAIWRLCAQLQLELEEEQTHA